jgi:modulator of FtsH protease
MTPFDELLKSWEAFYLAVATAAATLVGLLFVAVSVNIQLLRGPEGPHHRDIAGRTFGDFLFTLMLSLVLLIPHQEPVGLAVALFTLGFVRGVPLVAQAFKARGSVSRSSKGGHVVRDYALPLLATFGLIFVALRILSGHFGAVILLVGVVSALLVTACTNAWFLLLQRARATG